jgi:hypothetical protein
MNATYFKKGLGKATGGDYLELEDILAHGISTTGNILKIDIEGAEWEILESISAQTLKGIQQIVIELHDLLEIVRNPEKLKRTCSILNGLSQDFWAINVNPNNWANVQIIQGVLFADVLEISFLRKDPSVRIFEKQLSTRGFPNNKLAPRILLDSFNHILG